MRIDFIVIGAQKSASSFVQLCLSDHPSIYLAPGEVNYFESPFFENTPPSYIDQLFSNRTELRLGIKRPNYLGNPEVPHHIFQKCPNVKLIAVLRNPIERAVSSYFHNMNTGFLPVIDVNEGLRKVLDDSEYRSKYYRSKDIIEFGMYHKYLSMYRDYFPQNNIHLLLHDDIKESPKKSISSCYEFLDVDYSYQPSTMDQRPQKVTYNIPRIKISHTIHNIKFNYTQNYRYMENKRISKLQRIKAKFIKNIDNIFLSRLYSNEKPSLDPSIKERLMDIYRDDITQLENYLNRDLTHWKTI